jgi:hypothetical protein
MDFQILYILLFYLSFFFSSLLPLLLTVYNLAMARTGREGMDTACSLLYITNLAAFSPFPSCGLQCQTRKQYLMASELRLDLLAGRAVELMRRWCGCYHDAPCLSDIPSVAGVVADPSIFCCAFTHPLPPPVLVVRASNGTKCGGDSRPGMAMLTGGWRQSGDMLFLTAVAEALDCGLTQFLGGLRGNVTSSVCSSGGTRCYMV